MLFPDTKFVVPRLRPDTVERPELVEQLVQDVLSVPLTVLCAPAGYGKTTLASMVAQRWLSLDPDDNDPRRLLAGLGRALGLDLADPVALLNAVAKQPDDVVVALDEWEVITEPAAAQQLEYLVEWAPENLHMLVTSRQPPAIALPRLRARGKLAERGLRELRFTRSETATLLTGLADDVVDALYERTEGWPAGLRLAAAGGTLPPTESHTFDFLADEVFDRQPAEIQRFLLETSVLSTLSGAACAALTGQPQDVLTGLIGRGLPLTEQNEVYRYHPLFAEFLRRRLARWPAEDHVELHRKAARAEPDPLAQAKHLLAAGEAEAAAELVESVGGLGRAKSVRELLDQMPSELRDRPGLLVLAGDLAFAAGDLAAARQAFERAGPGGPIAARLVDTLMLQGEIAASEDLIDRTLAEATDMRLRVRLLLAKARTAQIGGRYEIAQRAVESGVDLAIAEGELETAATMSPALGLVRGAIDQFERFIEVAALPDGLARLQVDALRATVGLLRGRLPDVIPAIDRVLSGYERFGGAPPLQAISLAIARVGAAGPLPVNIDQPIDDVLRYAALLTRASFLYANTWFTVGRARWLRGQLDEAREARERMGEQDDAPAGSLPIIQINRFSLEGLIAISAGDHRHAERCLRAAVETEDRVGLLNVYGSARIRLAYLYTERRRPDEALRIAMPALTECEQQRLSGRILMEGRAAVPVLRLAAERSPYAARLLRQLDEVRPVRGPAEMLTAREVEVLRLLTAGATNREIARRLTLGDETVKTHVSRILRKLDVRTRTAAAAKARELGIIAGPIR